MKRATGEPELSPDAVARDDERAIAERLIVAFAKDRSR
jgi:hypothetical protein